MKPRSFEAKQLSLVGLNLQAVINIKSLSQKIKNQLSSHIKNPLKFNHYTQLILIGHGGKLFWEQLKCWQKTNSQLVKNPIDQFSNQQVQTYFEQQFSNEEFELIFPYSHFSVNNRPKQLNENTIGLQTLGEMVGWHHSSPFKVGINNQWGSWFAYRAVVLVKSRFIKEDVASNEMSPCVSCTAKPCVSACPANALAANEYDFNACIQYRKQDSSQCKDRCIARMACPVSQAHQYSLEQINYHYSLTMNAIKNYSL